MRTLSNLSPFPLALLLLLGVPDSGAAQSLDGSHSTPSQSPAATPPVHPPLEPAVDLAITPLEEQNPTEEWGNVRPSDVTAEATSPRDRFTSLTAETSSLAEYLTHQEQIVTDAHRLFTPPALSGASFIETALLAQGEGLDPETIEEVIEEQEEANPATPGFLSGSLIFTSNYLARGVSQTRSRPAIQGIFQYNQPVADDLLLYAGVLGTSLDFGRSNAPNIETDWYIGANYQISDRLSAGLIGYYFAYLGNSDGFRYNFWEIFPSLTYDFGPFSVTGELGYSPDWLFESGESLYLEALVTVPITENFFLSTTFVSQDIEKNTRLGLPDWNSWNIGLGYTRDNYTLSLMFSDTDIAKANCFGGEDVCDPVVVLSLTRFW
ncbi:MAG: TorF family putative porin [Spirulinaceae cyanobacterium]